MSPTDNNRAPFIQKLRCRFEALGPALQRVLVHALVVERLQMPPVESALAGTRRAAEEDDLLFVNLLEEDLAVVIATAIYVQRIRRQIEIPRELARRLAEEEFLGRLIRDADVVREVAIRTAEILGDRRPRRRTGPPGALELRRAPARVAHEDAAGEIDFVLGDVVVPADLGPHARPRLPEDVARRGGVHGSRQVELREHGAALLLEAGDLVLGAALRALRFRVRV